jgi:hypothetical protein
MIVFIESLGRNSTDPNNYFSVVEVVYKENDKALESYIKYIKMKSEFNPFFRVISKAGGDSEMYKSFKRYLRTNFRQFKERSNVFYLDNDLREVVIMGLDLG